MHTHPQMETVNSLITNRHRETAAEEGVSRLKCGHNLKPERVVAQECDVLR